MTPSPLSVARSWHTRARRRRDANPQRDLTRTSRTSLTPDIPSGVFNLGALVDFLRSPERAEALSTGGFFCEARTSSGRISTGPTSTGRTSAGRNSGRRNSAGRTLARRSRKPARAGGPARARSPPARPPCRPGSTSDTSVQERVPTPAHAVTKRSEWGGTAAIWASLRAFSPCVALIFNAVEGL